MGSNQKSEIRKWEITGNTEMNYIQKYRIGKEWEIQKWEITRNKEIEDNQKCRNGKYKIGK